MPTYNEYLQMNDDIKYEVIDGYIYNMAPSPSVRHQMIGVQISTELGQARYLDYM